MEGISTRGAACHSPACAGMRMRYRLPPIRQWRIVLERQRQAVFLGAAASAAPCVASIALTSRNK